MRLRLYTLGMAVLLVVMAVAYANEPLRARWRALDAADAARPVNDVRASMNVETFDPTRDAIVATGSVYAKAMIELSEAEVAEIELEAPGFWDQLLLSGWERVGNTAVRIVPAPGAVIRHDYDEITVEGSRFAFVAPRALARSEREKFSRDGRLTVLAKDVAVPADQVEIIRSAGAAGDPVQMDVLIKIDVRKGKSGMCHGRPDESVRRRLRSNATAAPMDSARCLDYNGYYTDGINHPRSHWRGIRNFWGSDCELALACGYCWGEYTNGEGCWETHGSQICSALVGHSSSYHTH